MAKRTAQKAVPQEAAVKKPKRFDPSEVKAHLNWDSRITEFYPSGSKELKEKMETKGFGVTNGVWITVGAEKLKMVDDPNNEGKKLKYFYREGDWEVREVGSFTEDKEDGSSDHRIVEYRLKA